MATRSLIGRETDSGKVKYIYCHWDGYPDWAGKILANYYQMPEQVDHLLSLGDLSSLGPVTAFLGRGKHGTVAHCRDMERQYKPPTETTMPAGMKHAAYSCGAEFIYIYSENGWKAYGVNGSGLNPVEIKP